MHTRRVRYAVLTAVTLALAGCGEREVATEHIRAVLAGAATLSGEPADSAGAPLLTLPNGDTIHVRAAVVEFYRDRGYRPAWTDDDEILPRGLEMLEAIGLSDTEGLDRERYHHSTAREMARLLSEDAVEDHQLEYLGNLDIMLTENFVRLAQDLATGTMDPRAAGLEWKIEESDMVELDLIHTVMDGQSPRSVLGTVRPEVPYYDRMVVALSRLRSVAEEEGEWPKVPDGETIGEGDEAPRVAALRARLMAGDDPEETRLARVGADRPLYFDAELRMAMEHFQTRHNLLEDGALGPNTLEALNVSIQDRIEDLRLNLDRWRWMPRELGERFIIVNVAGFELEVVEGDSAIESMNVVVGRTANRTPIFQDTLEYMVVNPYWNVPQSIAEEEILPSAERDPTYLERNDFEVVRENGESRIRQKPGPKNALGNVKFLFPNADNIYLHDTPAEHLFSQKSRAFSHGCIRVERPDDLARTLLATLTDRDPSEYDTLRGRSGEQWITFDEQVPVYILYFTAWVDSDGTIRFHEDIYDRDETLEAEREEKLGPIERQPIAVSGR